MKRLLWVFALLGLTVALSSALFGADSAIDLTEAEKAFLRNAAPVRVSNEMDWPPYNYNDRGTPKGFSIEYFQLIAQKLGLKYEFVSGPDWNDFLERIKKHELDVMLNIINTEERREYIAFTRSYAVAISALIVREENRHLKSLRGMDGKTIAIPKGFFTAELLRAIYPGIKRLETPDMLSALEAVRFGKADAAISELSVADFLIKKHTLSGLVSSGRVKNPAFSSILNLGTRKDLPVLRDLLQKGINAVTDEELFALRSKWLAKTNDKTQPQGLDLTEKELDYLKKRDELTMCVDPAWMPFEGIKNHKHTGIAGDFIRLFSKKLDKEIRLIETGSLPESLDLARRKKCDFLPMLTATAGRASYLNFTKPYFSNPTVLVTRPHTAYVPELHDLKKEVGVVEGYALNELITVFYPNLKIRPVKNLHEGMTLVSEGKLFGMVDTLAAVGYEIKDYFVGQLKVAGRFEEPTELGIAVRNDDPILLSIFNKVIDSTTDLERRNIVNSWLVLQYKEGMDYRMVVQIVITFVLVAILLLYKQKLLREHNANLEKISITDRLTGLNNRIRLDQELEGLQNRFERYHKVFSIILLDIDHFKQVNDTFGHLVGDAVLKGVANLLGQNCRVSDTLGRWGGEEFLVLCPQTDIDGAVACADALRKKIHSSVFDHGASVTASFGVAEVQSGETIDGLISRVDKALYEAKGGGRNRIKRG